MPKDIDCYWLEEAARFDEHYARISTNLFSIFVRRFLEERLRRISPLLKIQKGERILDVGCGSGFYLKLLIERGGRPTGIDYSGTMLRLSQQRLQNVSTDPLSLVQGDANQLPFKEAQYDLILAIGLLDYVADPAQVLREFHRVLKSEGHLIVTSPKSPSPFFFLRKGWGNTIRRTLFHLPPLLTLLTRRGVQPLLASNGFTIDQLGVVQQTMWLIRAKKQPLTSLVSRESTPS